jgi:hypothetical protein
LGFDVPLGLEGRLEGCGLRNPLGRGRGLAVGTPGDGKAEAVADTGGVALGCDESAGWAEGAADSVAVGSGTVRSGIGTSGAVGALTGVTGVGVASAVVALAVAPGAGFGLEEWVRMTRREMHTSAATEPLATATSCSFRTCDSARGGGMSVVVRFTDVTWEETPSASGRCGGSWRGGTPNAGEIPLSDGAANDPDTS